MTNSEFLQDCKDKREAIRKRLKEDEQLSQRDQEDLKKQVELLTTSIKIMTYGTGAERRRYRRDYERRLGL